MIQIDDAGSGSLVGGTCIAAIRADTGEYYNEIIPIKLYNKRNFKKKLYIYYTTAIVKNALLKLKVSKNEEINICQGYIFEDAREYLSQNLYNFNSCRIDDPLQAKIEKTFEEYTIKLGLPSDFISYTRYPFHFHRLLKWVYADYDNRIKFCKTGWKSWEKYGSLPVERTFDKVLKSNYICLKCGEKIQNNSAVKVITFISNDKYRIYLHKNC